MKTMIQVLVDADEAFRDAVRYRIDDMPLEDVRGFADEDGNLDLDDLVAFIIDDMEHDGTMHEIADSCVPVYHAEQASVLASRPGIAQNLSDHGIPNDAMAGVWADIAACICLEIQESLGEDAYGIVEDEALKKWPNLKIDPEVKE